MYWALRASSDQIVKSFKLSVNISQSPELFSLGFCCGRYHKNFIGIFRINRSRELELVKNYSELKMHLHLFFFFSLSLVL